MTNVILNKNLVEKLLKKKIKLDDIKDKITMFGTPLESINDNELIIEVFPNRPDLLSEQGFSRALNSFLGYTKGLIKYNYKKSNYKVIVDKSVNEVRPYTAFFLVKNIKLNDDKIKELINIQEKLHLTFCRNRKKASIGIYPAEKITLPIHYKLLPKEKINFKPLESTDMMSFDEILTKHETGKKYARLLDNLNKCPVFIDDKDKILSLVPIINSDETGKINKDTKEFFVECTGVDLNIVNFLSNILATTFIDMEGEVYAMEIKYHDKTFITPELKTNEIMINLNNVNKLLGLNLDENETKNLLEKMGFNYENKKVTVPCYRTDIFNEVDIIEEIAIAYGYENFKPEIPNIATIGEEDKFNAFKGKISSLLIGLNLIETSSYIINDDLNLNKKMKLNNDLIMLSNSLNQNYNSLRNSILPCLLKILKENKHNEYPQKLFEIGKIFIKGESETGIKEYERLGIILSHINANFTDIKQILDFLLNSLNLKYDIIEVDHNSFIKGRVGRILVNDKKLAYIGELNPEVLRNYDLELPCACLEINLTELFEIIKG